MEINFLRRHPVLKDVIGFTAFVICVFIGTIFLNSYVFRSFSVIGPSMEKTLYTGDRLVVDRFAVTWSQLQNKEYAPERGQIIVFKNPKYIKNTADEYIVKRVIAFAGERVLLKDGKYTVYNKKNPNGFNPDDKNNGEPGKITSGEVDMVVPDGEIFVSGDHREGRYSYDSRNGLGTIPLYDVVGPVSIRIYPFQKMRTF